jgi:hypothetical protein
MSRRIPPDPLGGHVRLYWKLLDTPAYIALSNAARALYVDLRRKLLATNNGNIECTMETLRIRGWRSHHTLFNALHELLAVGLLEVMRQGGLTREGKLPNLYRFTDVEVFEHPKLGIAYRKATHDYRQFQTLGHARAVLRQVADARKEREAEAKKKRVTGRAIPNAETAKGLAETAEQGPFTSAETASRGKRPRQKLHQADDSKKAIIGMNIHKISSRQ